MTDSSRDQLDEALGALGFRRIPLAEFFARQGDQVSPSPTPEQEGSMSSPAVHRLFGQLLDATAPDSAKPGTLDINLTLDEVGQLFLMCADHVMRHQLQEHPEHTWISCTHPISLVRNVCEITLDALRRTYQW